MFKSIYCQFDSILETLGTMEQTWRITFTKIQIEVLVHFLDPLQDITDTLSQSENPTLHLVVPIFNKLVTEYKSNSGDLETTKYLKRKMLFSLETKLFPKLKAIHFAAAALDFRFKTNNYEFDGCPFNSADGKALLKELMQTHLTMDDQQTSNIHVIDDPLFVPSQDIEKEDELESYFAHRCIPFQDFYKGKTFDVFGCWSQYNSRFPNVYKLACWLLSVPATSVLSEKNFSDSKWMINSRRTNLKPENVSCSLVLKSSYKY